MCVLKIWEKENVLENGYRSRKELNVGTLTVYVFVYCNTFNLF